MQRRAAAIRVHADAVRTRAQDSSDPYNPAPLPRLRRPTRTAVDWRSRRPALAAAALCILDAALALAGHPANGLAIAILLLAPGLALARLLPAPLRREGLALAAAVPALGFAATSIAFITAARVGIPLTGVSCRIVVALIVAGGLAFLPLDEPVNRPSLVELGLLVGALAVGIVLEARVLHGYPVPGNDWAKYLLYADEIRRHGAVLIRNPYWMLGVPFRDDPGAPAVYGGFLTMTHAPVSVLAHGIWVFAVMGILSTFAYVRALWGPVAAGLAAVFYAVLPINQDILGWHGLANVAALALMPLILLAATELLRGRLNRREAVGLGLLLIALAAAHRLSASIAALALVGSGVLALLVGPRLKILRSAAWTAAGAVLVGWGVLSHLSAVNKSFGGTQGYQAYLNSKLNLHLVVLDMTWPFSVAAAIGVAWALWRLRKQPELGVPLVLLAVVIALGYSYLVHVPLSYLRMAYYLPVMLAPLLAVALVTLGGKRARSASAVVVGLVLACFIAVSAYHRAGNVRSFYLFADQPSLRGLDAVTSKLKPGEVVVTDRCWSFLSTWLLHTRTLAALYPEDIAPKAELPFAREAQSVLSGTPAGVALARRLGVRYIVVDPQCVGPDGLPIRPPLVGNALYASGKLVILGLPLDPREEPGPAR